MDTKFLNKVPNFLYFLNAVSKQIKMLLLYKLNMRYICFEIRLPKIFEFKSCVEIVLFEHLM